MNILFVLEYFYPRLSGGEELISWRISNALSKRGHGIYVITSRLNGTPEYEVVNDIEIFRPFSSGGVLTQGGISGINALLKRAFFSLRLYPYIKHFLEQHPVDIIYNHAYVPTMATTYLASKRHVPVITAIRALAGKNWLQLTNPFLALFGYLTEITVLRFARHTALLCPSAEVSKNVKRYCKARVFTIPNPLDTEEIKRVTEATDIRQVREELGIKPGEQLLLFVGSLVKIKNVDGLITALSRAKANFKLVIIGDGPERPRVEELVKRLGLKDRVILLGRKSHEETLGVMKSCDLLLLPSRTETFSNVIVEALALGTPVISTKVGIAPQLRSSNLYLIDDIAGIGQLLEKGIEPKEDERILVDYSLGNIIPAFEGMVESEVRTYRET